jgi:hypothetical protein
MEKENKDMFDLNLVECPINLANLYAIQKLQVVSFTQTKARKEILKSHIDENELLNLVSRVL